jgi:hypothetical protein
MTPNEKLAYWLQENNLQIQLVVLAPKGGVVSPENYIPDGWRMQLQVIEAQRPNDEQDAQINPGDRVSNLPPYKK